MTHAPNDKIAEKINNIRHMLSNDDTEEALAEAGGYIDALLDFSLIDEEAWSSAHRTARTVRDETLAKIAKKEIARKKGRNYL